MASVFSSLLENVEFKKVIPSDYRLFQVADFVCAMQMLDMLMQIRLEMLKVVNDLKPDYQFSPDFIDKSRAYFENGDQTTVLAFADETVIGCATMCYIKMMPTFDHPTGQRAHLMNVYTNCKYRRHGIAYKMVNMLIEEAKTNGI